MTSRVKEGNDATQDRETVSLSRLIIFLNDWVQSLLVSSGKKVRGSGGKAHDEVVETCLDFRCWKVFKFCLEESLNGHISLSYSRNLLRSISLIARNALSQMDNVSSCPKEVYFISEGSELYSTVLDCMSLLFSSNGGLSNENLDLWVSTVNPVFELTHKSLAENFDSSNVVAYVLQFSCLICESFAKFLRAHPTKKTGFRDFIDKLLEPLMHLSGILHRRIDGCNPGWTRNLLKLVEDILSDGLFHPVHIDGFLSLHGTEEYVLSDDGNFTGSKTVVKSYHRHLFHKLERIMTAKKDLAVCNIGVLFHLFVDRVTKLKGSLLVSRNGSVMRKMEGSFGMDDSLFGHTPNMFSENDNKPREKSYCSTSLSAERRKSVFDFFVLIMGPLLLEIKGSVESKCGVGPVLLDVHCTLKSINSLLASFTHEKVYVRTEDTSEGACLNFLKKVYDLIISLSSSLIISYKRAVDNRKEIDILTSLADEILVSVGYLLEIEYEVIEHDLVSLWLMMLSYLAIGFSLTDGLNHCSLRSRITDLGCQLLNLYSQLRQVSESSLIILRTNAALTSVLVHIQINTYMSTTIYLKVVSKLTITNYFFNCFWYFFYSLSVACFYICSASIYIFFSFYFRVTLNLLEWRLVLVF